ncbi:MAG: D-alanine--D-alanine ligase A, partial [Chloroflexi bacterium]|nr:D-alanine--D-alanine ligase A [Chloroflexota bacterium]
MRVAVLFGGRSGEHEVSLASAANVMAALDGRHEVVPVGIDREGRWLAAPDAHNRLLAGQALAGGTAAQALASLTDGARGSIDVVFPVLHGPYGEDGA